MNEFWNLDPIYQGFEDPRFEEDLAALKSKAAEMAEFAASLEQQEPQSALIRGIELMEQTMELGEKLAGYSMLRQSTNSRGVAQAKAVLFFILVAGLSILQLRMTRDKEVAA